LLRESLPHGRFFGHQVSNARQSFFDLKSPSAPTGCGKTAVLEMALARFLLAKTKDSTGPGKRAKAIYGLRNDLLNVALNFQLRRSRLSALNDLKTGKRSSNTWFEENLAETYLSECLQDHKTELIVGDSFSPEESAFEQGAIARADLIITTPVSQYVS
jgi:hypothetical protein